jgi:hypothetical protein
VCIYRAPPAGAPGLVARVSHPRRGFDGRAADQELEPSQETRVGNRQSSGSQPGREEEGLDGVSPTSAPAVSTPRYAPGRDGGYSGRAGISSYGRECRKTIETKLLQAVGFLSATVASHFPVVHPWQLPLCLLHAAC